MEIADAQWVAPSMNSHRRGTVSDRHVATKQYAILEDKSRLVLNEQSRIGSGGIGASEPNPSINHGNSWRLAILMSEPDDQSNLQYSLSEHARTVLQEREILLQWVTRTLREPEQIEPHSLDPSLRHALARIPENGDRVLRVVYNYTVIPPRIVTAYFDRSLRDRL